MEALQDQLSSLVSRVLTGDIQAYAQIVRLTQDRVLAAAQVVLHDEHAAEDAAQEAYLRAYRRLGSLRDSTALVAWLTRTARRCALDQLRCPAAAPLGRHEPDDDREEQRHALARAMVRLSADDRRLFERYYLGGRTTAQIAAQLDLTDAAVRKRLERIRQRMRKEIAMVAPTDLPQRIIDLLARPILTDLPENPVGAVWVEIRASQPLAEYVSNLPEKLRFDDAVRLYGEQAADVIRRQFPVVDAQHFLRGDVMLPLLMALEGKRTGTTLITTGKAYRNSRVDALHLEAFHQAGIFRIGKGEDEWALTGWMVDLLQKLLGQTMFQFERSEEPIEIGKRWEVYARWFDRWTVVGSFGALTAHTVRALGHDSARVSIIGVCFGLERVASLRYGIDDIRKVEVARVDER